MLLTHPDNSKVVFENGVFDLDRKVFSTEIKKDTVQFSSMPYKPDHTANCPQWLMFLDSVLPERAYQDILQEFLGSIFIDRYLTKRRPCLYYTVTVRTERASYFRR